jgi:hypothetical protein
MGFTLGKHFAFLAGDYLKIGCTGMKVDEWLEKYRAVGIEAGYTEGEIERYGKLIKFCKNLIE